MYSLIAHIHPFAPRERIARDEEVGKSISEIVNALVPGDIGRPIVLVNGSTIDRDAWESTYPKDGDHVLVKVVPAGGEARGKAGGWGVAIMIASIIAIPFTGGLSLYGVYLGAGLVVGAGIAAFGSYLQGMFDTPKGVNEEYSGGIRGGRNQAGKGKSPVILGKHLVVPPLAARPYTEIGGTDGVDVYLRQLFEVGYGPLRLSQFKIGENLLATNVAAVRNGAVDTSTGNYTDVELQVYQDGTSPSLYPSIVLEDQPNAEMAYNVEHWLTTAPNTTKIDCDITLPRGLYQYNDSGSKLNHSVTVEVRRRAVGSGTAWASCTLIGTFSLTKALSKTLRYNVSQVVSAGQYEVGMKRTTADDPDDFKGASIVTWSAFRSIRTSIAPVDATYRARHVYVALKIKATKQLNGVVDQLNCIAEAEIPAYDGSGSGSAEWANAFTRNPAAAYLWYLRGPMNPRPRTNASIDWARLESWYTLCQTKGWTCDAVINSGERLRDTLQKIASTGRAALTLRDGLYSVVVDEPKTTIVQHFTPVNVKRFSWSKAFKTQPHGLKISFISATDGYSPNERVVLADNYLYDTDFDGNLEDWNGVERTVGGGYALATQFESIQLWGITDPDIVLKHGRFLLASMALRPEAYVIETDPESIVCEVGDLVVAAHDAIVVSAASGRVTGVTLDGSGKATSFTTDTIVPMDGAKSYAVRYRKSDMSSKYKLVNTTGGENTTIYFSSPVDVADNPAVDDMFTVGEAGIETVRCIVAGIEMHDELDMLLTLVDEAPGVHTADSGTIPAYVSRVSRPPVFSITDTVADATKTQVPPLPPADIAIPTGFEAFWDCQAPEIPNNTAGTTWRNIEQWTSGYAPLVGNGSNQLSIESGLLKVFANSAYSDCSAIYPGDMNGKILRVVCKYDSRITGLDFLNSAHNAWLPSAFGVVGIRHGDHLIFNVLIQGASTENLYIRIGTNYSNPTIYIRNWYLGDATNSQPNIDNTGHGHHQDVVTNVVPSDLGMRVYATSEAKQGTTPQISIGTTFSMGIKIRFASLVNSYPISAQDDPTYYIQYDPVAGSLYFSWLDASSVQRAVAFSVALQIDTDYMFGASHDGANGRLYLGGVCVGTQPGTIKPLASRFGFRHPYGGQPDAHIKSGFIAARVLSDAEFRGYHLGQLPAMPYSLADYKLEPANPQNSIVTLASRYLGKYNYVHPGSRNNLDWWTVYDTDAGDAGRPGNGHVQRGVWYDNAGTATRIDNDTGANASKIVAAMPDILWATNNGYGEVADYGTIVQITNLITNALFASEFIANTALITSLGASSALIVSLLAQYLKIQVGGSLRGGDRYDETGAVVDSTKPGFFIAASGACKVAGLEFEGSQGGGVQWGGGQQVGSGLAISVSISALAALNATDVAFVGGANGKELRTYRWSGSSWSLVGSGLAISTTGNPALAALNATDVAFIDGGNDELRLYRWSGSSWSLVGSGLAISTTGGPALAALNSTDVAFIDSINDQLRTYRWSGSSWSLVGSGLSIASTDIPALAALSSTDVAFVDNGNKELRTYRWSGSSWSLVGSGLAISGMDLPAIAALNGTDVAFIDSVNDQLRVYRWSGASWSFVSSAGSPVIGGGYPALASMNGTDIAFIDSVNDQLRLYRYAFALSKPWRYPFAA